MKYKAHAWLPFKFTFFCTRVLNVNLICHDRECTFLDLYKLVLYVPKAKYMYMSNFKTKYASFLRTQNLLTSVTILWLSSLTFTIVIIHNLQTGFTRLGSFKSLYSLVIKWKWQDYLTLVCSLILIRHNTNHAICFIT